MQKFTTLEQLEEGKLYIIETILHQRILVFRDQNVIRTNAQEVVKGKQNPVPVRIIPENEVVCFEEFAKG